MLLYDIVDITPTKFTIKNDGVLQSRTGQANSLPAYRIGTPTINSQSQSDPVTNNVSYNTGVVNSKNSFPLDNNSTQVNTKVISDVVRRASIRYGLDNVDEESVKTISFSQRDVDERKGWKFCFEDNTVRSQIQDKHNNSLHLYDTVIFESNDFGNISYGTGRILVFVPIIFLYQRNNSSMTLAVSEARCIPATGYTPYIRPLRLFKPSFICHWQQKA